MTTVSKYWCQSCNVYMEAACKLTTHRSEQMKLEETRWVSYSPSRVFERKLDKTLQRIMLEPRQRAAVAGHQTRERRAQETLARDQRDAAARAQRLGERRACPLVPQPTEYEQLLALLRDNGGYGADAERMAYAALQARSEPARNRQQLIDGIEHLLRSLEHPTAALPRYHPLALATLADAEEAVQRCRARGYHATINISSKPDGEDNTTIAIHQRVVPTASNVAMQEAITADLTSATVIDREFDPLG